MKSKCQGQYYFRECPDFNRSSQKSTFYHHSIDINNQEAGNAFECWPEQYLLPIWRGTPPLCKQVWGISYLIILWLLFISPSQWEALLVYLSFCWQGRTCRLLRYHGTMPWIGELEGLLHLPQKSKHISSATDLSPADIMMLIMGADTPIFKAVE